MQNNHTAWIWVFVLGCLFFGLEQKVSAQGTSTPEERARWAEITHKLEINPLTGDFHVDSYVGFKHGMCANTGIGCSQ